MSTFSALIDEMIRERQRPDMLSALVSYANQVIRQIHSKPGSASQIQFDANRYESELVLTDEAPFIWPLPTINFQSLEAMWNRDACVYHTLRRPAVSREQSATPFSDYYWYRSANVIAIGGAIAGQTIDISFFAYPRRLQYKPAEQRAVVYNAQADQYVLAVGGGIPSQAQLDEETNWILQRWPSVVEQGVRNALFANVGDVERGRVAFSIYENLRNQLWLEEPNTVAGQ